MDHSDANLVQSHKCLRWDEFPLLFALSLLQRFALGHRARVPTALYAIVNPSGTNNCIQLSTSSGSPCRRITLGAREWLLNSAWTFDGLERLQMTGPVVKLGIRTSLKSAESARTGPLQHSGGAQSFCVSFCTHLSPTQARIVLMTTLVSSGPFTGIDIISASPAG